MTRPLGGSGYYAELAHQIGSELNRSSNQYVEAIHQKLTAGPGCASSPGLNPYVEELHKRLSSCGGNSPPLARSPAPGKNSAPSTSRGSLKNEYVESLHAKLQKMGRQPVASSPFVAGPSPVLEEVQ